MSNRPDSFFTMYGGDFLRDTMHLTTRQIGAYQLLLIHYYAKGGPLPLDDEQIRAITREDQQQWKADRALVMGFFTKAEDGWHQKRADKELIGMQKRYERAVKGQEAKEARKQELRDSLGVVEAGAYDQLKRRSSRSKPQPQPHTSFGPTGQNEVVGQAAARAATAAPPVPTEPDWVQASERWSSFKTKLGEKSWEIWFSGCRLNGSETTLIAPSNFRRDEIGKRYFTPLEDHFGEPITIKTIDGAPYASD